MGSLRVTVHEGRSVAELAACSRAALDRPLEADGELLVGSTADEGLVLGAFQRPGELPADVLGAYAGRLVQRGSGGGEVRAAAGTVWLQLALRRSDALVAGPPDRLINRHVRPLLKALSKQGVKAGYFDRDWVGTADKRVVAAVSFGHDARSGRALFEAFVPTREPMAVRERAAWRGRAPGIVAAEGLLAAIAEAYVSAYGGSLLGGEAAPWGAPSGAAGGAAAGAASSGGGLAAQAGWSATCEEAIGVLGAAREQGRVHIGGELMASRDAVTRLEERLSSLPLLDALSVGAAIDEELAAPGVAVFGVRSLRSLCDILLAL
ncbi:MAG: hypothetical protein JWP97_2192 [Labilithrix sp.]|nr:hypothetical protein [Labilithrix sp.]